MTKERDNEHARTLAEIDFEQGRLPRDTQGWIPEEAKAYEETFEACTNGSN